MKKIVLVILIFMVFSLFAQTVVEWKTNMGDFKAELREDLVPITAYNFRDLVEDEFFDGFIFHRVIADFMIQDGDPTGTGYGGPGYHIQDEFHPELTHVRGVVSMANTGSPNTGGSQYFIPVIPTHHLDNAHAIFGHIIEGMEIVDAISEVPTDDNDKPIDAVVIDSIRILTPPITDFIPVCTRNTVDENHIEVFIMNSSDYSLNYEWYIDEELQTEPSFVFTHSFTLVDTASVDTVIVKCVASGEYDYDYELEWKYVVNSIVSEEIETISPSQIAVYPNPFNPETTISYQVEESGQVDISIYNLKGQRICELVDGYQDSGSYQTVWKAEKQVSGIYLLEYRNGNVVKHKKLVLMK